MGYPDIFDSNASCMPPLLSAGPQMLAGQGDWLNSIGDSLDTAISTAATNAKSSGIDVTFSDPRVAFSGKGVCGSPEDIHELVVALTRGDNPALDLFSPTVGLVASDSFHPTVAGAQIYANVATATLKSMGE